MTAVRHLERLAAGLLVLALLGAIVATIAFRFTTYGLRPSEPLPVEAPRSQ
jgi:hypothetical protein